jgi:hypothetical protein
MIFPILDIHNMPFCFESAILGILIQLLLLFSIILYNFLNFLKKTVVTIAGKKLQVIYYIFLNKLY